MNIENKHHKHPGISGPRPLNLSAWRSIISSHHGTPRVSPSRIETVIFAWRPSYKCRNGQLINDLPLPPDVNQRHMDTMSSIVEHHASSIGMIEVEDQGVWKPVCTCFRTQDSREGTARVLTAGHALLKLMHPGAKLRKWKPLSIANLRKVEIEVEHPVRSASVRFAASATVPEARFPITSLAWAHPAWDMLMCEIDAAILQSPDRKPVPLQTEPVDDVDAHGEAFEPICVLGFPMSDRGDGARIFDDINPDNPDLRASPGFLRTLPVIRDLPFEASQPPDRTTAAHDASTLPGSSGSPVFNLLNSKVIGMHFDGGKFRASLQNATQAPAQIFDPNRAIFFPLALQEPFVNSELINEPGIRTNEMLRWDPSFPRWSRAAQDKMECNAAAQGGLELSDDSTPADFPMLQSVLPDRFDSRDRVYRPSLLEAQDELLPPNLPARMVRDQQREGACTAFALGATINMQLCKLGRSYEPVSERMLYELARLYDEWMDDSVGGTSLRAVIKAFYQNGVCLDRTSPFISGAQGWTLTRTAAREARGITLGAYYRLQPDLLDFQLALIETGAIIVSAHVHSGWNPSNGASIDSIPFKRDTIGAHAFVIVGYDRTGFIIQNSWGKQWGNWHGQPGLAHWKYQDWADNLIDAWVLRLAPSTPDAFDLVPRVARDTLVDKDHDDHGNPILLPNLPRPRRFSLVGHTVQIEHDRIIGRGRLGMSLDSIRETALYLGSRSGREKYKSVAFFFHDPQLNIDSLLRLCMYQTKPFMAHGIYPVHVVYGLDEGYTIRLRSQDEAQRVHQLTARSGEPIFKYLNRRARDVLHPLYRSFEQGIERSTRLGGSLWQAISSIVLELDPEEQSLYLFASGFGFVAADATTGLIHSDLSTESGKDVSSLEKVFLLAPSCTLRQIESRPVPTRVCSLKASSREAAVQARFEGYWPDLAMIAGHEEPDSPNAIRSNDEWHDRDWYAGASEFSTLHAACADPFVLNDCLEFFAGNRDSDRPF